MDIISHSESFLLSKVIGCPSCLRILSIMKSFTLMWTLNGFVKFGNFNVRAKKAFLSSP